MNSSTVSLHKIKQFDLPVAILLVLLGCVLFFFSFDRHIVSILKTTLMHEMGVGNTDYSLLITAFMLPYTIMCFFSGALVDRYGSRLIITGLMVLMAIATLVTGLTTSLHGLIA
ncbi:MFS transporter [Candidatus Sodalis endolongispinus]|uniref:Lysosomal dipeptide transporter MFSD1 n=1 Tax=Candidatus Sodalis endolongispinus TaxID=2812662 RepID=A0ABS5YD02_9GAMM|nr:MFS transporter [Candidatus Sodalis endolongispinus]MBT9432901.1 MFS transporter [Candidatus Sodalis endolongispinus]